MSHPAFQAGQSYERCWEAPSRVYFASARSEGLADAGVAEPQKSFSLRLLLGILARKFLAGEPAMTGIFFNPSFLLQP